MKQQNYPLPERLAELELLASETGLVEQLKTRRRAEIDKRRAELAAELKALPNPERRHAALAKNAARADANFVVALTAYQEAERQKKASVAALVVETMTDEGKRQHILSELERKAPPELADALDDLSFADTLLRDAIRTDEVMGRNWTGQRVYTVKSNCDAIASARKQVADGQSAIRELAHDGEMPSDAMVTRCAEILDAAMGPAFEFIPRKLWDLRHDKPGSDIVAEVAGYPH
ncbi:hypothetical protein [Paraburkholderia lacunae]|uniref:Uncharacterized protein n=1 Tax=Paraburkholderia lacunae TaxID=2211104 RepID=A0A370NFX1_9BURK|nr:hypothetical protein [Paraburkholderia lacunae]RDK04483.1 hypothetical protein DLM46_00995 [Paraburkholderia lacunae]